MATPKKPGVKAGTLQGRGKAPKTLAQKRGMQTATRAGSGNRGRATPAGMRPFVPGKNPGILGVASALNKAGQNVAKGITPLKSMKMPDIGKGVSNALQDRIIGNPGARIKQVTGQK